MPIKRKFTRIPALQSVTELLVALQLDGHLDGFEIPDWAEGTSVEELFNAVSSIGDGEWLAGAYPDHGSVESADRWLSDFMNGKEVPTADEVAEMRDADEESEDDSEEAEAARQGLRMYAEQVPTARRAAFAKKLAKPEFHDLALRCYRSLGLAVAAFFAASDAEFKAMHSEFVFLEPASLKDEDLAAMAMTYMVDGVAEFLSSMEVDADTIKQTNKRAKAMVAKIKKATASRAA